MAHYFPITFNQNGRLENAIHQLATKVLIGQRIHINFSNVNGIQRDLKLNFTILYCWLVGRWRKQSNEIACDHTSMEHVCAYVYCIFQPHMDGEAKREKLQLIYFKAVCTEHWTPEKKIIWTRGAQLLPTMRSIRNIYESSIWTIYDC